jgi:hypothetical protein
MLHLGIFCKFHIFANSGHQGAFRQVWRCAGCVKISPLQLLLYTFISGLPNGEVWSYLVNPTLAIRRP